MFGLKCFYVLCFFILLKSIKIKSLLLSFSFVYVLKEMRLMMK